jgi:hypothetical protein
MSWTCGVFSCVCTISKKSQNTKGVGPVVGIWSPFSECLNPYRERYYRGNLPRRTLNFTFRNRASDFGIFRIFKIPGFDFQDCDRLGLWAREVPMSHLAPSLDMSMAVRPIAAAPPTRRPASVWYIFGPNTRNQSAQSNHLH